MASLRQTDGVFGAIVQLSAVRQSGEGIEMCQVLNTFLGLFARGNVSGDTKQHYGFAVRATHWRSKNFKPALRSAESFDFELQNPTFATNHAPMQSDKRITILGKKKVYEIVLLRLLQRICFEHGEARSVHLQEPAVAVKNIDAFRLRLDDGPQALFALP